MLAASVDVKALAVAAGVAGVVFFVSQRLYVWYRLKKAPGARALILSENPISTLSIALRGVRHHNENRLLDFWASLFEKIPDGDLQAVELVFFGNRLLATSEPEHVKTMLTGKFTSFGKGEDFHDAWKPFLGDSIFTTDGKLWQNSRSLIRPMFVKDRIRELQIFDRGINGLFEQLPPPGQTVDLCDLFYRMTLDVTTEYLLGASVGSLQDPQSRFSQAFSDVQRASMVLTILLPIRSLIPKSKYYKGIAVLEEFIDPFIEKAMALSPSELENMTKGDAEVTFLHQVAAFAKDRQVLRDQILAVLLAGRDTTAATLSWTIYELSHYPEIWEKLRKTILDTVGQDGVPTYDDLKGMTYLTHCINETLRLYPAVPYNIRSCVETTTLTSPAGQPDITVLAGDQIMYSPLYMQRRPDLYPPTSETFADPAIYSPERWEHWTPKPWQYIPFNGGPRICIGQNFAITEMAYFLVRLLQKYERIEYRGDWSAQLHKAELVGCPGKGVPVALFEPKLV